MTLVHCTTSLAVAEALLAQKQLVTNWDEFAKANGMTGWSNDTLADVCTWTGVTCDEGAFSL